MNDNSQIDEPRPGRTDVEPDARLLDGDEPLPSDIRPGELGVNGYPLGYTKEGDKAEWLPDEDDPEKSFPAIIRRNDDAIGEEIERLEEAVWWNRHQVWLAKIRRGEEKVEAAQAEIFLQARVEARKIEERRGKAALIPDDDLDWGMTNGKLSALRWVMGWEWEGAHPASEWVRGG